MIFTLANLLAAKGPDENIWVQVIFMAVVIGFGILKKIISGAKTAMKEKPRQNDEEEHQPQQLNKTTTKRTSAGTADEYKTLEQLREERVAQIRAAFGIPEPPKQAAARQVESRPIPLQQRPVHRPVVKRPPPLPKSSASVEMEYAKPAEPKAAPAHSRDKKQKHITPPAETSNVLIRLASPQDLRSAILYQEILGPPVALR
jgi:hypothetical protein